MFKKKLSEIIPKPTLPTLTLQKYQPTFTTIDGETHVGHTYKWASPNSIACSIPKYIMCSISSDGYLCDKEDIMYMLPNIISIVWEKVDEIKLVDNFYHEYQIFFSDKMVNKKKEKDGEYEN